MIMAPVAELSKTQDQVRNRYSFFATKEVPGRCPIYEDLAHHIAADDDLIAFIASFPPNKRQPNLFLASMRKMLGRVPTFAEARSLMLHNSDQLKKVVLTHSTQTNEPGRCAALLPILSSLPQPLALLEIGPSAGLCLIPDFYSYDFNGKKIDGKGHADFTLFCEVDGGAPIPDAVPEVVWRAGLDTNPMHLNKKDDREWLETLIWPSEDLRLNRLRSAVDLARGADIRIDQGDLHSEDLDRLCAAAPKDATLVVFHSAVLSYTLDQGRRDAFADRISDLTPYWLSNESPTLFSGIGSQVIDNRPGGDFLITLNRQPMAWSDPHGATLTWLGQELPTNLT